MQKRTRRAWKREQARRRRPWLLHAGPSFHRAHPSEARGTQSNTSVGQAPGPGSEAQALLGKGGSSRSVPRIWPPLASQCQAARPQSLWRKFWFAVPEGQGPPRRLPTPWDCLGAGHRKVLREAQPSRWGYSWVLPGALQAIAPFSEPSGPQWMQGPSPRPLLPAPGGPFLPRTPGLIPTHTHMPAPLLLSPTLLPPVTRSLRWRKLHQRLPGATGPTQHPPAQALQAGSVCTEPGSLPGPGDQGIWPGHGDDSHPALFAAPAFSLCTSRPFSRRDPGRSWSAREVSGWDRSDLGPRWARCLLLRPPLGTQPVLGPSWKIPRARSETRAAQASPVPPCALPRAGAVRASLPTSTTPGLLLTNASVPDSCRARSSQTAGCPNHRAESWGAWLVTA